MKSMQFLIEETKVVIRRFPFVVLISLLAAALSFYSIESKAESEELKLLFTCILGLPLFLSVALYLESRNSRSRRTSVLLYSLAAVLLLLFQYLFYIDDTKNYIIKYVQLSLAIHLLVSFAANIGNEDEVSFWQINKAFFLRILNSFSYAGAFFVGLSIAISITSRLFDINVSFERYIELGIIAFIILQTWHFLSGVPKDFSGLRNEPPYPQSLKYFIQYLLIPLVSLYSVILYCYMLKIVVTNSWPEGYVGWLVSIMSVIGVFNLLLIYPEKSKTENKWINAYSKYYFVIILPLLGMLFIAIGKRISEYGITEKRYFLLVLGLWLSLLSLYFIFRKFKNIKIVPVSLFFVSILTLWGPISASNISLASQIRRAKEILTQNKMFSGEKLIKSDGEVTSDEQKQLGYIFDYIVQNHGIKPIANWFPEETITLLTYAGSQPKKSREMNSEALMKYLGLNYFVGHGGYPKAHYYYHSESRKTPIGIKGFDYFVRFDSSQTTFVELNQRRFAISFNKTTNAIEILENEKISTIELTGLVKKIRDSKLGINETIPNEFMYLEGFAGKLKYKFFIENLNGTTFNEKLSTGFVSGYFFF